MTALPGATASPSGSGSPPAGIGSQSAGIGSPSAGSGSPSAGSGSSPAGGPASDPGRAGGEVFREAARLGRALVAQRPGTTALALGFLIVSNVMETFGLLMLIPLIEAAGFGGAEAAPGAAVGVLSGLLDGLGAPLTLPLALGLFVALVVVRALTAWQREVLLARTRLGFVDRLREELHRAVARARWEAIGGRREADLRHVLTGEVRRIGLAVGNLLQIVVAAAVAAIPLGAAFLLSPGTSGLILVSGLALLLATWPLLRRSGTLGQGITDANREIFHQVQDFLGGLKEAKSQAAEAVHHARFGAAIRALRERRLASAAIGALAWAALQAGAAAALAAIVWFALAARNLPLPELAVVILLSARTVAALGTLQRRAHDLANTLPAVRHARETLAGLEALAEESAVVDPSGPAPASGPSARGDEGRLELRRSLTLREVSFRYPVPPGAEGPRRPGSPSSGEGRPEALRGVALTLEPREFTALSGPSGAGKSTLAEIASGLLRPSNGAVLVDGVPLAPSNLRRWRASCAVVAPVPYLFHDTLRANLAWPGRDADPDRLRAALRAAAAADFVARLPRGLDTVVGERGGRLSGGERQRIGLARALLREPTLLVLDEATGALDAATESRIVESLRSLASRLTIFAVTHRRQMLDGAHRVLRLEAGRITADSRAGERVGAAPDDRS